MDISPGDVTRLFRAINTNKATGPDGVSAFPFMKTCADELTPAWVSKVFQRQVGSHTVPSVVEEVFTSFT